jgi:threonine dehydrogenase-like Zn-dependent dehydrogenase
MRAKTMRAISKVKPGPGLELTEVPVPVPGSSDVLIRIVKTSICGTDVHIYNWDDWAQKTIKPPMVIGHEFVGVIEDLGADVEGFKAGDLVVAPFVWSDGTCDFCEEGLQTSCRHGGLWARDGVDGGQGEAVRVPQAQGTLVKPPVGADSALLPSLLTLADVFPTGYHCARTAGANARTTVSDQRRRRRPVGRGRSEAARR